MDMILPREGKEVYTCLYFTCANPGRLEMIGESLGEFESSALAGRARGRNSGQLLQRRRPVLYARMSHYVAMPRSPSPLRFPAARYRHSPLPLSSRFTFTS